MQALAWRLVSSLWAAVTVPLRSAASGQVRSGCGTWVWDLGGGGPGGDIAGAVIGTCCSERRRTRQQNLPSKGQYMYTIHAPDLSPAAVTQGKLSTHTWTGHLPSTTHLHPFGSNAYVYVIQRNLLKVGFASAGACGDAVWIAPGRCVVQDVIPAAEVIDDPA